MLKWAPRCAPLPMLLIYAPGSFPFNALPISSKITGSSMVTFILEE